MFFVVCCLPFSSFARRLFVWVRSFASKLRKLKTRRVVCHAGAFVETATNEWEQGSETETGRKKQRERELLAIFLVRRSVATVQNLLCKIFSHAKLACGGELFIIETWYPPDERVPDKKKTDDLARIFAIFLDLCVGVVEPREMRFVLDVFFFVHRAPWSTIHSKFMAVWFTARRIYEHLTA